MTVNPIPWKRRRLTGGAALLCLTALIAACGPFLPPPAPTPGTSVAAVPSQAPPSVSSVSGTPAERLALALMALQGGYTFDTTLRVGDKEAARVVGRWYGDASELSISSGGATVTYRIIPPSAWLQEDTGVWVEADAAATTGDPMTLLLSPLRVEASAGSGDVDQIVATYPATALGLTGPDPVSVTISIATDATITTRYEAATDAGLGISETVLKAAPSQDPIVAPSPLPAAGG